MGRDGRKGDDPPQVLSWVAYEGGAEINAGRVSLVLPVIQYQKGQTHLWTQDSIRMENVGLCSYAHGGVAIVNHSNLIGVAERARLSTVDGVAVALLFRS